jgi:two-component system, NtrC family, nitrogen regulation sensor histidine kinase NtrY
VTLRARLFALVSVAVVVTVVLVAITVSASARQSFAAVEARRTEAFVTQLRADVAAQGDAIIQALARMEASDSLLRLRADVARGDSDYAAYVAEAATLAAAHGLDFLDLVLDDGTILSSAHWPARFGHRNTWAVRRLPGSRSSDDFLQAVDGPQGAALGLVAVHAVDAGDRRLYLAGGRRLDADFLRSLPLPPSMQLLLYGMIDAEAVRPRLVATSGVAVDDGRFEPFVGAADMAAGQARAAGRTRRGESVHAMRLAGRDGTARATLLIVSAGDELAALIRRIRWSAVAFGGLGIALGSLLSYVVASRVTRPVEELAAAARTIADGDWNVHVQGIHASPEIGALADAFAAMTRQLSDQRERLVQAERVAAWREVARRLAHELKNPLFPLRITLDNLRRAKPLPPAEFDEVFDESVQTLTVGVANLNTVIGRFSDFARMPAPTFDVVAPNAVVKDTVALFRRQFERHPGGAIEVALELDADAGTIRADAEQLGRMLQNLLLNAVDAMDAGGTLAVRTRRTPGIFHLTVSDTGRGIDPGERDRLFTPYYTTKQHGTGLGLAIVQSVVTDHHGKISVDGAPGRGTTFHVELPA